jgi:GH15 family glucan-1,4-alpha-glucosidase
MSTSLVLANGSLLINIDYKLRLKDLYYPHIGSENQLNKYLNEFFISINNKQYAIKEENFNIEIDYKDGYLYGKSILTSKKFDLIIELKDAVLVDRNIYIREIFVENKDKNLKNLKFYFQQNFALYESDFADTVYWDPLQDCLIHYKKNRYLAFGFIEGDVSYSCAAKKDNAGMGAVINNIDNNLDKNPISTGNVSSLLSKEFNDFKKGNDFYFIIAGKSLKEIQTQINYLRKRFSVKKISSLKNHQDKKFEIELQDKLELYFTDQETHKILNLYKRSLDIIKTQIDNNGAIIAANDGQYLKNDGTDSYSYVWPRDACEVIKTLIDVGEKELSKKSLEFLNKLLDTNGFMGHKYYPFATNFSNVPASSWQPWLSKNGNYIFPIQEDSTSLYIQATEKFISKFNDQEYLFTNWKSKIKKALSFIINYRFNISTSENINFQEFAKDFKIFTDSNLIMPSYDIWEQYYGLFTNTLVQVISSLDSGIVLAEMIEDFDFLDKLKICREELMQELELKFFDNHKNIFLKGIYLKDKEVVSGFEADSSLIYLWKNKVLDVIDPKVTSTMQFLIDKLQLKTHIKGYSRKEDDHYLKISEHNNPWVISTLWFSQYYYKINDLKNSKENLLWVIDHADRTGILSEQINPNTGFSLGVKPLTWSHAEYINTVNQFLK